MSYLYWLFGFGNEDDIDDDQINWCSKQRQLKYEIVKDIKRSLFFLEHIHNDTCKCDKPIDPIIKRLKKKKPKGNTKK